MPEKAKGFVKKVTLEMVYEVVDERTKEILERIRKIEERQEEDFRYLNQKIDTQTGQVRNEMGQLRQEIGQLRQEMTQMREEFKTEIHRLDEKIDRMNQRIDTVIQMLSEIMRSK